MCIDWSDVFCEHDVISIVSPCTSANVEEIDFSRVLFGGGGSLSGSFREGHEADSRQHISIDVYPP